MEFFVCSFQLYHRPARLASYRACNQAPAILDRLGDCADYQNTRDFPAPDATSKLSAHLKFGTCSVQDVYYAVTRATWQLTSADPATVLARFFHPKPFINGTSNAAFAVIPHRLSRLTKTRFKEAIGTKCLVPQLSSQHIHTIFVGMLADLFLTKQYLRQPVEMRQDGNPTISDRQPGYLHQ
ncbi:MAG: hypothetical protein M0Q44_17680 [Methylobacter sp.]|nr:hypothetical protein [Methylobacter sp.]